MVWELWGGSGKLWEALGSSGELWGCKIIEKINENQWFDSSGEALGSSGGSRCSKIIEKAMKINGLGALGWSRGALESSGGGPGSPRGVKSPKTFENQWFSLGGD